MVYRGMRFGAFPRGFEAMPALSEHVNMYNVALKVLSEKGFQVWTADGGETICAEREGWDFFADSPVSLLGLVAIFEESKPETFSDYWWRPAGELDYRNLPAEPKPYQSVITQRE